MSSPQQSRNGLRHAAAIWLIASLLGIALMALLPEELLGGNKLFHLNERHGPGSTDAIGLLFILGGWAAYLRALWIWASVSVPLVSMVLWGVVVILCIAGCLVAVSAGKDAVALLLGSAALVLQLAPMLLPGNARF